MDTNWHGYPYYYLLELLLCTLIVQLYLDAGGQVDRQVGQGVKAGRVGQWPECFPVQ